MTTKSTPERERLTPIVSSAPNLSRFSDTICEVRTSASYCEKAIEALGRAQLALKPGPLSRFLAVLECDLAVHLDNQNVLVAQLEHLIETRIRESEGQPE